MLMRPRYRRPFATTNRFSVTFTTAMPRRASVRELSGRIRRRREESVESGTATQRAPAGIDPTGTPLAASLTKSSPPSAPPIDAYGAPVARPTRSSGSAAAGGSAPEGVPVPPPRGQPTVATSATLVSARFAQRRIELCDREVDIGFRVGRRDKT